MSQNNITTFLLFALQPFSHSGFGRTLMTIPLIISNRTSLIILYRVWVLETPFGFVNEFHYNLHES
jgi:hypothetical protein